MACSVTCFNNRDPIPGDLLQEFTSSDFSGEMISKFKEFREEELFCDFTLKVDREEFKVSTYFVIVTSYFDALLYFSKYNCQIINPLR